MDIHEFGVDWQLTQFEAWNRAEDMILSQSEEAESDSNSDRSKRRKLNSADSVQEESWLNWLDCSGSSLEAENQLVPDEVKYGLAPEAKQNGELKDEDKTTLSSLMAYLLDQEIEDCQETDVFSGETIGDQKLIERSASDVDVHHILQYILEQQGTENQEFDVSSSKTSERQCLVSSASSAELQINEPQSPDTNSGNQRSPRGLNPEWEELSEDDSEGVMILDQVDSKRQAECLVRTETYDADGARRAEDNNSWEELQISKASHPATPESSEETDFFHCYDPQTEEDYNAVRVVHLLTACAEAETNGNEDLAAVILTRIEQLLSSKESTIHRVASHFYQTLRSLINHELPDHSIAQSSETISGAFQLLHEVCPYNKFAHLTANQAILEAVEDESVVHIIDFDIMEGLQWPPLIESLATRSNGISFLRITAVQQELAPNSLSSSAELTGRRLFEIAETFHIPFSFDIVTLDEETGSLKLDKADQEGALVANCMLQLPHMTSRNPKSIYAFVSAISKMQIKVVTISDEALKCTSTNFTERFFEILHHSCALFDSVEASLSAHDLARAAVETTFLAPRICSMVTTICQQEKDEDVGRARSSCNVLQESGLEPISISHCNQTQAKLLLAFFKEGYRIEGGGHEVAICWGDTPLVEVSVWQSQNVQIL
ncbi:hypothetical protein O6H91_06G010700 [Diphasiastrum complanatum]|uniref:Uncharacterized protein n=1 Tax=Diphasiastrum complanatum TaxID=34168 RepID=A0ACC2DAS1_DIPCM|nr:hypothetical protein O6H91_Y504400 [Diphasiastrum complanatum]KAJ7551328.1 hypothetical protein O6H91_06G010700 [Diphasiastrum complanatum]